MSVFFISDLHLTPERPDIARAFSYFLSNTAPNAESLYLLGDIFDAWIGDDAAVPGLEPLVQQLKTLSDSGCKLYFQHGNRDFLVGQTFADSIGAELLPDAVVHSLPIGDVLLMHGDQLCIDDQEYIRFREMVRNPQWQQMMLSKSIEERLGIAKQLRETSQEKTAAKADYITDVNASEVNAQLDAHKVNMMIHGHTHRPAIHKLDDSEATRIVLGDWDKKGWYLEVNQDGYDLVSFDI